jgi:hypothetical protein
MELYMTAPPRRFFLVPPGVRVLPGMHHVEDALGRTREVDLSVLAPYEVDRAAVNAWSAAQVAGAEAARAAVPGPGSTPASAPPLPAAVGALLAALGPRLEALAADPEAAMGMAARLLDTCAAGLLGGEEMAPSAAEALARALAEDGFLADGPVDAAALSEILRRALASLGEPARP